jgi:hypothetical protein
VFQGGTALSRAHRVIERMSEDIDIKIVSKGPRPAPRRLRANMRLLRSKADICKRVGRVRCANSGTRDDSTFKFNLVVG